MITKIRDYWQKNNLGFYASVAGSFAMGTIHLISLIVEFSWLTFNYMLFCYMIMLIRVLIYYLAKKNSNYLYLIGAVCVLLLLVPLGVSLVKTITDRDAPVYFFDWLIYGYATYGTYKMVLAIVRLAKVKKEPNVEANLLSWISLISASFTLFMMQFLLSKTFGTVEEEDTMFTLLLLTHGAILILTIFVIFLFAKRFYLRVMESKIENYTE